MNGKRSTLGFTLLALLVINASTGTAQDAVRPSAFGSDSAQASANNNRIYHIEISMLASCIQMGCEHRLTEQNAVLSDDGRTLPARVGRLAMNESGIRPPVPVHLLVVFAPAARRRPATELAEKLGRLFSAGWLVSAQRADGTFTPYSDRDGLLRELGKISVTPVSSGEEPGSIRNAVEDLSGKPGWRFLLVEATRGKHRTAPVWLNEAASRLDRVYAVDGGKVKTFPDCDRPGSFNEMGYLCNGTGVKRLRSHRDGVIHEVKWSKAIRHLRTDRKYDYNLEFSLPASAEIAGRPLTLTLRDPYSYGPDPVHVEFYTIASGLQVDAAGTIRKDSGFKITVVGPSKVTGLNRSAYLEYRHKDILDADSGGIGSHSW